MFRYNRTSKHLEIILVTHGERKDLCPNAETWVFFAHSCSCILHWWQLPIHTWWNPDLVIRSCCVFNPQIVASASFSDWKIAYVKIGIKTLIVPADGWYILHTWYRIASLIYNQLVLFAYFGVTKTRTILPVNIIIFISWKLKWSLKQKTENCYSWNNW